MKNNNLMKIGVLSKLKGWLLKVFHKLHNSKNVANIENHNIEPEKLTNQKEGQNTFEEYRQINNKHQYLLELQKKLENNLISESELNHEDKAALERLYMEQINELQMTIYSMDKKIQKLE